MARPFKSAGRHACNCLIPSRHAISHSTIQVIPEVTPEAPALFLNNSTSGLHARWRYLVYPILARIGNFLCSGSDFFITAADYTVRILGIKLLFRKFGIGRYGGDP